MKKVQELRNKQKGATVIEYALIAALISVAAIVAFGLVGNKVGEVMNGVDEALVVPE
ncbi:MAG: Flp family type IVb pilin [Moraxellaceae bacterium]|nr:Flp family type IVb pilin [Moraxellaceae bacterium]MDZ4387604.1 Flp family type IVb pilin [Moraxellaceae bacterium]